MHCYDDCLQGIESLDNKKTDVALVLQRMGEIQMNKLNKYVDATKLFIDSLEILKAAEDEGSERENIMSLVLLIAQAYALAKDYEHSLDYYEEHIKLIESNAPINEDLLADSLNAMANIFAVMDKNPDYELAIEKFTECLEMKKKLHGSDNEQAANILVQLGTVFEKAGHHDRATNSFSEALRIYKMKQNRAASVKAYHALAKLKASKAAELDSLPERMAAIECYREALKIQRQILSLDGTELALMLYEYATLLCSIGEHMQALPLLEEALRFQKSNTGLQDGRVANILLRIADVHVQDENYDASLVCLEQVLFIQKSLDDDSDIDAGLCHYLLGVTYFARGDFPKAIASYLESIDKKQLKFGRNSLQCATLYNDLGRAYGKVNEFDKAIDYIIQALRIRKTELGNNSLDYGHSV